MQLFWFKIQEKVFELMTELDTAELTCYDHVYSHKNGRVIKKILISSETCALMLTFFKYVLSEIINMKYIIILND